MRVIKRYSNRKLYDTQGKRYITLTDIAGLVRGGEEIQIIDNETGDDLTALTLTQIILEEERKTRGLMPRSILTGLIQAGGDTITTLQRTLFTSINFWRQVDQEIKNRIDDLVKAGFLNQDEGQELTQKMIEIGLENRSDQQSDQEWQFRWPKLQNIISEHHIPSRQDLLKLQDQVDELASKIEDLVNKENL